METHARAGKPTNLYRHRDEAGRLLYVGISLNALTRLRQHQAGSGWFQKIARVDIETHPSRSAALAAENRAIRNEAPLYNQSLERDCGRLTPKARACDLTSTELDLLRAEPREKGYRLPDTGGLHLYVSPTGTKTWRMRYKLKGKEQLTTFGRFPAMSLADARQKRDTLKRHMRKASALLPI